jgi:hypothetical protein
LIVFTGWTYEYVDALELRSALEFLRFINRGRGDSRSSSRDHEAPRGNVPRPDGPGLDAQSLGKLQSTPGIGMAQPLTESAREAIAWAESMKKKFNLN